MRERRLRVTGVAMGESVLHLRMKESVSRELAEEGYSVFFEPPYAPSKFLTWVSYRPDLFGIRASPGRQEYALVECETRPSGRRLASKNFRSVDVQTRLNSDLSLRRILVVPRGKLAGVDPSVRRSWETWIYEGGGFQRFPRACEATAPASRQ
jgi:hypothetical protein